MVTIRAYHMMRGEILAWYMGMQMLDALNMVKTDLAGLSRADALTGRNVVLTVTCG
jgi:hypothetical protein